MGRNFDFIAGDAAEIIVRTTSKEGRYATIGMFGGMLWLNSDMLDAGLNDEDVKEFIPHFMLDGINEKGVAMESNVVKTLDAGGFTLHTNPGQKEVPQYCLIRYVLDRAASADEAVEIMKSIDIIDTLPDIYGLQESNYELHFLITDKDRDCCFFIPFYIFSHEKYFPEYESNEVKLQKLCEEYSNIRLKLDDLQKAGEVSEFTKSAVCVTTNHVLALIAQNYHRVQKGVENVMRGKILDYEAKTIRNEERKKFMAEIEERAKDMLRDNMTFWSSSR